MLDGAKCIPGTISNAITVSPRGCTNLANNAAQIAGYEPSLLFPSHGRGGDERVGAVRPKYISELRRLGDLYVRGYDIQTFDGCDQDNVSRPSEVPHLWQVSPHLYKFRGPNYWVNFRDAPGRQRPRVVGRLRPVQSRISRSRRSSRAKERLGLKQIDAIFVTHMHGDHALDAEYMREKYGANYGRWRALPTSSSVRGITIYCALLPSYNDRGKDLVPSSSIESCKAAI